MKNNFVSKIDLTEHIEREIQEQSEIGSTKKDHINIPAYDKGTRNDKEYYDNLTIEQQNLRDNMKHNEKTNEKINNEHIK